MYFRGYQKTFHVLLCEDDLGANGGKGTPVKRASYEDCELLESTGLADKHGREIYEGDRLIVNYQGKSFQGEAGPVPDMFRSRRLHPLHDLLQALGIPDDAEELEFEITGSRYDLPKV